jgi:hypothetical protein
MTHLVPAISFNIAALLFSRNSNHLLPWCCQQSLRHVKEPMGCGGGLFTCVRRPSVRPSIHLSSIHPSPSLPIHHHKPFLPFRRTLGAGRAARGQGLGSRGAGGRRAGEARGCGGGRAEPIRAGTFGRPDPRDCRRLPPSRAHGLGVWTPARARLVRVPRRRAAGCGHERRPGAACARAAEPHRPTVMRLPCLAAPLAAS